MIYKIMHADGGISLYGGNLDFVRYRGSEALLHGPAESGKSYGMMLKVHLCACRYPEANIAIARKTQTSTYSTILQTFMHKILGPRDQWPCVAYGGENKPERFIYPNGATIWVAGLDKSSKILSSEFDLIAVSQAEELTQDDWETLTTRATGRAGHMPYAQTIGDANPSYPQHWMYHRPSLRIFYSHHEDNPTLFDPRTGEITAQGKRTMSVLDNLTGVRRMRLRDGKPAQAEGVVYEEWDESIHLIYERDVPAVQKYVAAQDWGWSNPGVLSVWAVDNDGRIYRVAEYYKTKQTIDWWVDRAQGIMAEFMPLEAIVCDPSTPEYIEQYKRAGLPAVAGENAVLPGINAVKERLKVAGDGKARLFIVRDSLREQDQSLVNDRKPYATEHEFPAYVWANTTKEQPVKEHDHCLVAGTFVKTLHGELPIERVTVNDYVLTRQGYRRVLAAGMVSPSAEVMTATLSDNRTITGTPNHRIWIKNKGYIELRALRYGDMVEPSIHYEGGGSWQRMLKRSFFAGLLSGDIQMPPIGPSACITLLMQAIERMEWGDYIKKFGSLYTEKSRRGTRFITRTGMRLTIPWRILRQFLRQSTGSGMQSTWSHENFLKPQEMRRRSGIDPKRAASGTASWASGVGRTKNIAREFATIVKRNIKPALHMATIGFAPIVARQRLVGQAALTMKFASAFFAGQHIVATNTVAKSFVPIHVLSVSGIHNKRVPVYDLTVNSVPEFFANGILVHNSMDSLRYLCAYLDGIGTDAVVSLSDVGGARSMTNRWALK